MLNEITKIAFGVTLALVLAFSLAGISYYFPASNKNTLSVVELTVGNISSSQAGTYVVSVPPNPNQMLWVYLGIAGLAVFAAIVVGVMLVVRRTKTKSSLGSTDK